MCNSWSRVTDLKKLFCSFQVSGDITDSGDHTIPWASPSTLRDRTLPGLSSSTSSQGSIPECIQNEQGQLIVTHRGRFQVCCVSFRSSMCLSFFNFLLFFLSFLPFCPFLALFLFFSNFLVSFFVSYILTCFLSSVHSFIFRSFACSCLLASFFLNNQSL